MSDQLHVRLTWDELYAELTYRRAQMLLEHRVDLSTRSDQMYKIDRLVMKIYSDVIVVGVYTLANRVDDLLPDNPDDRDRYSRLLVLQSQRGNERESMQLDEEDDLMLASWERWLRSTLDEDGGYPTTVTTSQEGTLGYVMLPFGVMIGPLTLKGDPSDIIDVRSQMMRYLRDSWEMFHTANRAQVDRVQMSYGVNLATAGIVAVLFLVVAISTGWWWLLFVYLLLGALGIFSKP